MSNQYPTNGGSTEFPDITEFTFDEPRVYWLYVIWIFVAVYNVTYILINKFYLSKARWYKVVESDSPEVSFHYPPTKVHTPILNSLLLEIHVYCIITC